MIHNAEYKSKSLILQVFESRLLKSNKLNKLFEHYYL